MIALTLSAEERAELTSLAAAVDARHCAQCATTVRALQKVLAATEPT